MHRARIRGLQRPPAIGPALPAHELSLLVRHKNVLIDLDIAGKKELVLVKDVQKDPVRQIIEHLDLRSGVNDGGTGVFGGFLPATAFAMVASTGDIFFGLWYPVLFAIMTFVIGMIFIPETKDRDIYDEH